MRLDINEAMEMAVEAHKAGDYAKAASIYQQALNAQPHNPGVLYLLGDIATRLGNNGVAINLLKNSTQIRPMAPALIALGCAYKAEHFNDEALEAWEQAAALEPSTEVFNNISSLYSDSGQPHKALQYIEKSLAISPDNPNAHWNKGLALLTDRRWKEAWPEHENRFDPRVQKTSIRRSISETQWDGSHVRKLAVHGEQGVGDEIMFLSVLHEAVLRADEIVIEVEPRLLDIVERSFPGVRAYGNEKALKAHEEDIDAQIALGTLPMLFRNSDEEFPRHAAYLRADPDRVEYWLGRYAECGPRPYIGVAWAGGTKSTRFHQRTIQATDLSFATKGTAISIQYGDIAKEGAEAAGFHFFPESTGADMNEQFAMIAACDVIITVAQTAVHVASSMGKPTYVLVPQFASWRYGMGKDMLWYGENTKLLRQHREGDWSHPLKRAEAVVDEYVEKFRK